MIHIEGLQKVTLLDYPKKVACTVFTKGCNFNCSFCQNSSLIKCDKGKISEEEVLEYINKRKNILDGVVVTGGEPLVQKDIKEFIKKVKDLGLLVKLDTNGSNSKVLKELINEKLVDYVAMDIKNIFLKYKITIGKDTILKNIEESIKILKESSIDYEFRTTIVKELHTINDIRKICEFIGKKSKYYLQNFEDSEDVINHNLHGFTHEELVLINDNLKENFPNMEIRALT